MPVTKDFLSWEAVGSRRKRSLETEVRSLKRSPKNENRRLVTSKEQSDDEDSVGEMGDNRFVDATAGTEVELSLPLEVDMKPDQKRKHVPILPECSTGSGTDIGCRCLPTLWAVTGGQGTSSRIQPNIPGNDPTPTGYRDTAGKANI